MKYPFVVLFRHEKYSEIDKFYEENKDKLFCTVFITSKKEDLNKLFEAEYHILVTYGDINEYINNTLSIISDRMRYRWLHYNKLVSPEFFSENVTYFYINVCSMEREIIRPIFSIFSTTYNSYEKILRAYESLKEQKMKDWEWVIVDDSPTDEHFNYLREVLGNDNKIRLYRRSKNSGNIGNVKNESISLCRGKYVLEFDHDDSILPDTLMDATKLFNENPDVGFIYMDFINLYENGDNFLYGNNLSKGYASYYCQKYKNKWVYVFNTPNINNITLSHLVSCPNHPRIWRKETLIKAGNYCEFLPICDDYEILLRTAVTTKIAKINKLAYVQYMNNCGNFSLIRNSEINRIGPKYIFSIYYKKYKIHEIMKENKAFENPSYIYNSTRIWERDTEEKEIEDDEKYVHRYANLIINYDYDKHYCILGLDVLTNNLEKIKELYKNSRNDFFLIDVINDNNTLFNKLVEHGLDDRFKFFNLDNCTSENKDKMKKYFDLRYKTVDDYEFIE